MSARLTRKTKQNPIESPGFLSPLLVQNEKPSVSAIKKLRSGKKIRRTQDLMGLSFTTKEIDFAENEETEKAVKSGKLRKKNKKGDLETPRDDKFKQFNDEKFDKVLTKVDRNIKSQSPRRKSKINVNNEKTTKVVESVVQESAMNDENLGHRKIVRARRIIRNNKTKQTEGRSEIVAGDCSGDASNNGTTDSRKKSGGFETSNSSNIENATSAIDNSFKHSMVRGFPTSKSASKKGKIFKENCLEGAVLELDKIKPMEDKKSSEGLGLDISSNIKTNGREDSKKFVPSTVPRSSKSRSEETTISVFENSKKHSLVKPFSTSRSSIKEKRTSSLSHTELDSKEECVKIPSTSRTLKKDTSTEVCLDEKLSPLEAESADLDEDNTLSISSQTTQVNLDYIGKSADLLVPNIKITRNSYSLQIHEEICFDSDSSSEESDINLNACNERRFERSFTFDPKKKSFVKLLPSTSTEIQEETDSDSEESDLDLVADKKVAMRSTTNDSEKSFGKVSSISRSIQIQEANGFDSGSSSEKSDADLDTCKKVASRSTSNNFFVKLPAASGSTQFQEKICVDSGSSEKLNSRSTFDSKKSLSTSRSSLRKDTFVKKNDAFSAVNFGLDIFKNPTPKSKFYVDLGLDDCYNTPPITTVNSTSIILSEVSNKSDTSEQMTNEIGYAKAKSGDFLVVSTLPSPISPSEKNVENSPSDKKYLDFKSSQENLHPSTSGAVNTIKRRTYELEESTIDISCLKSLSDRDSKRISSVSSSDSKTPTTFSKVTTRRKWNKSNNFSPIVNLETPSWVKKSPECIVITDSGEKKSTTKKFVSKVKVPNFAAIHKKALDKIENLSEYKDRKEARAKLLLAGGKPKTGQKSTTKPCTDSPLPKKSRKELRFAPGTSERQKSPTYIPLPSTPLPKYAPPPTLQCNPVFNLKPFEFSKENLQPRIPVLKAFQRASPKGARILKPVNQRNVFTLKGKNCTETQKNQIKSIITKSKPVVDVKEARRCAVKGIRTNRRFELLMNMRKGK